MVKVVLFVFLVGAMAQIFPSCGGGDQASGEPVVIGWVEGKRVERLAALFYITINHIEYDVPANFWSEVRVGDLVKWDGQVWTIVRRAGS